MTEKETYQIYVGIMKIHKKYISSHRDMTRIQEFISDINQLNSTSNSNFCNSMTEVLRRWFIRKFPGVEASKLTDFYTDMWRLHKKYINLERNDAFWEGLIDEVDSLAVKYPVKQSEEFLLAIVDELEQDKGVSSQNKPPDGHNETEAGRTNNEQKEKEHPNQ